MMRHPIRVVVPAGQQMRLVPELQMALARLATRLAQLAGRQEQQATPAEPQQIDRRPRRQKVKLSEAPRGDAVGSDIQGPCKF
jgi:hypothetical protein